MKKLKWWQFYALMALLWVAVLGGACLSFIAYFESPTVREKNIREIGKEFMKEYPMLPPDHPPVNGNPKNPEVKA